AGEIQLPLEVVGPVGLLVALGIAPDRAQHRWPRALDHENAALAAADGVPGLVDDVGEDAGQRERRRAGLGRRRARQRRNEMAAGLGLPPRVDDRAAAAADGLVVPHPRLGIDRLADRAEDAQRLEFVFLRQVAARLD